MLRHPERERLGAAEDEKAVHRAQNGARRVLNELEPLDVLVSRGDDHATDRIAVAIKVLRRAVHHEIRAKLERTLQARAGEGVVYRDHDVVLMSKG